MNNGIPNLRDYQNKNIQEIRDEYRKHQSVIYTLPTGGGKTVVLAHIARMILAKGTKTLILAHRRELVHQISSALHVEHGLIYPGVKYEYGKHLIDVGMVQTVVRRMGIAWNYGFIIVDEAHHAIAGNSWGKIMGSFPNAKLLGVTATPCRLDGRPLGRKSGGYFDSIVIGPTTLDLINSKYLCPIFVYQPDDAPDLSSVPIDKKTKDFATTPLSEIMDNKKIRGCAIEHYRKYAHNKNAVAFCVNVAHAEKTAQDFKDAGYQAAVLTGKTPDAEREKLIKDLGSGNLHVLTSVNTISEGTDVPGIEVGIMLRPSASLAMVIQQIGRVMRIKNGKTHGIIFDHAGNTKRHDYLPADAIDWNLNGKPKKRRTASLKQCPECFAWLNGGAKVCECCGFEFGNIEEEKEEKNELEHTDEELKPIDAVAHARDKRKQVANARSLQDLLKIEKDRGYKRGWSEHIMRARNSYHR